VFPDVQLTIVTGDRLLGSFDQSLREYTEARFRRERIRVRTGVNATRVDATELHLSDNSKLPYGLLIWNTGIGPRVLVQQMDSTLFAKDRWGHLVTDYRLRVLAAPPTSPAFLQDTTGNVPQSPAPLATNDNWQTLRPIPGLYAMGDCASVGDRHYAATAQVAEQQGRWLGQALSKAAAAAAAASGSATTPGAALIAQLQDTPPNTGPSSTAPVPPPDVFEYQHRGSMAFVGGFGAVANLRTGSLQGPQHMSNITGPAAFAVWRSAYLTQLGSWRNRLQVRVGDQCIWRNRMQLRVGDLGRG
jgi:NADH:ubiquinone reductase (non-electrogenic)